MPQSCGKHTLASVDDGFEVGASAALFAQSLAKGAAKLLGKGSWVEVRHANDSLGVLDHHRADLVLISEINLELCPDSPENSDREDADANRNIFPDLESRFNLLRNHRGRRDEGENERETAGDENKIPENPEPTTTLNLFRSDSENGGERAHIWIVAEL